MNKKTFRISIEAPRNVVWNAMWDQDNYRDWSSAWAEGSEMVTDMKKGSKVQFLDGKGSGMLSKIDDIKPNEFIHFQHLGIISEGKEITGTPESVIWEGYEHYTLIEKDGKTEVIVELKSGDIPEDFQKYFEETFPKALARIREIALGKVYESKES